MEQTQSIKAEQPKESKEDRIRRAVRQRIFKRAVWIGTIALAAVLILWLVVRYAKKSEQDAPGVFYPDIGRRHIGLGDPLPQAYNSNPPSSGAHYGSPANWGVYDYEVNDRLFIHNMEHGGVWISYRPSVSARVAERLKAIADEFGGSKVVMAPRATNDSDIAVAAWTRVLKFDLVGGDITDAQLDGIRAFYKRYKNHGPEFVPDAMPGVDPKSVQQ